eukprot:923618-Rhodomonas_salina.1
MTSSFSTGKQTNGSIPQLRVAHRAHAKGTLLAQLTLASLFSLVATITAASNSVISTSWTPQNWNGQSFHSLATLFSGIRGFHSSRIQMMIPRCSSSGAVALKLRCTPWQSRRIKCHPPETTPERKKYSPIRVYRQFPWILARTSGVWRTASDGSIVCCIASAL